MKLLVTGAGGFLGRHVVAALRARGHAVRALVRPASRGGACARWDGVEVHRADLRSEEHLAAALEGVDTVVHLAAQMTGDPELQFASTVGGTERLLQAMESADTRRLVLVSSLSVYRFDGRSSRLDEDSPIESGSAVYERDGYAIAKIWQERVARRFAARSGMDLRTVRPGYVWGAGHAWLDGLGLRTRRLVFVIGPRRRLPLTHVENCADGIALVSEHPGAAGETFNLVDAPQVDCSRYVRDVRRAGSSARPVAVPYALALAVARLTGGTLRAVAGPRARLPGVLVPSRFRARFMAVDCSFDKLGRKLGWSPPLSYARCLERSSVEAGS